MSISRPILISTLVTNLINPEWRELELYLRRNSYSQGVWFQGLVWSNSPRAFADRIGNGGCESRRRWLGCDPFYRNRCLSFCQDREVVHIIFKFVIPGDNFLFWIRSWRNEFLHEVDFDHYSEKFINFKTNLSLNEESNSLPFVLAADCQILLCLKFS